MPRRTKVALLTAAILLAALGLATRRHPREPQYKNHSLSYWLSLYLVDGTDQQMSPQEQAADAVRHIGTNAIPYLLTCLDYDARPRTRFADTVENHLPPSIAQSQPVLALLRDTRRFKGAAAGFALHDMGPLAQPAVPGLARLATNSSPYISQRAAYLLADLGPAALPALVGAATNLHNANRHFAIHALRNLGTNALPVLSSLLHDSDPAIRELAEQTMYEANHRRGVDATDQ